MQLSRQPSFKQEDPQPEPEVTNFLLQSRKLGKLCNMQIYQKMWLVSFIIIDMNPLFQILTAHIIVIEKSHSNFIFHNQKHLHGSKLYLVFFPYTAMTCITHYE